MKKYLLKTSTIIFVILTIIATAIPFASAATQTALLDSTRKVSVTLNCTKPGYGYPTQKFFDDLDELKNGDEIYICVLNRTLKYTVTDTDVVEPDDSSKLQVIQGEDLLTLVTCTPYGINSHRLLVHAERAEYKSSDEPLSSNKSNILENLIPNKKSNAPIFFLLATAVVLIFLSALFFMRKKHKAKKNRGIENEGKE